MGPKTRALKNPADEGGVCFGRKLLNELFRFDLIPDHEF